MQGIYVVDFESKLSLSIISFLERKYHSINWKIILDLKPLQNNSSLKKRRDDK